MLTVSAFSILDFISILGSSKARALSPPLAELILHKVGSNASAVSSINLRVYAHLCEQVILRSRAFIQVDALLFEDILLTDSTIAPAKTSDLFHERFMAA